MDLKEEKIKKIGIKRLIFNKWMKNWTFIEEGENERKLSYKINLWNVLSDVCYFRKKKKAKRDK